MATKTHKYTASSIKVLKDLAAVRKRPAMYIGNTSTEGLHHIVYEVVDNSIDETLAGYCSVISVVVEKGDIVLVEDNGRGIPVDNHPVEKVSALEVVMTKLHAGGKFDKASYKVSGGLHGVGVSVVNALSEWCEVEVHRNKKIYYQRYQRGLPDKKVTITGQSQSTGTKTRFKADPTVFETTNYSFDTLSNCYHLVGFEWRAQSLQ